MGVGHDLRWIAAPCSVLCVSVVMVGKEGREKGEPLTYGRIARGGRHP